MNCIIIDKDAYVNHKKNNNRAIEAIVARRKKLLAEDTNNLSILSVSSEKTSNFEDLEEPGPSSRILDGSLYNLIQEKIE